MKKYFLYFLLVLSSVGFINPQKGLCEQSIIINSVADSLELVNFYNATGGSTWDNPWYFSQPMSMWYGVTLNDDGCVICLDLDGIFNCDNNVNSILGGNNLVGNIPDLNLPQLEILNLSNNDLTGSIPDFSNLPNLKTLFLDENNLEGNIPNFSNLPNLIRFHFYRNNLTGTIPDFSNLPNLSSFECSRNQLTGSIPNFSNLPNLETFYCEYNELSGMIPDFSNVPNLTSFKCDNNELTGSIPNFSNIPDLEYLDCSYNSIENSIPDFSNIPNLEVIRCVGNNLAGPIPDFSNIPKLEALICNINDITGGIPDFSNLPELIAFDCRFNQLSGSIPDFSNIPKLEIFRCGSNQLTGSFPDFSNLPELEILHCIFSSLSGSIPNFSNLPNLKDLYCEGNQLTGSIPEFSNLPNLQRLYISSNQLTGSIPDLSALDLVLFYFENNNLEGCYPFWLCDVNGVSTTDNPSLPDGGSEIGFNNFCSDFSSQFGLPCDDGDPATSNTVIQPDCSCSDENPFENFVEGTLFLDTIINCVYDAEEYPMSNWLITAVGDSATYYDVSDSLGYYKIYTDIGDYTLHVEYPNAYWGICDAVEDSLLVFANPIDTFLIDIPVEVDFLCPVPTVDISTPFLRRCFSNIYSVHYCNEGTIPLEDGYIEITFDEFLIVNSSTNPWVNQDGQTYTFDIEDLDINGCGSFEVNVTVDCDSTVLGQTHCVEAHIFPDSICFPPNGQWDGSTIKLDAVCEADSLKFLMRNIGINDMSEPSGYIIIQDDLILRTGSFMIPAGGIDSTYEEKTGSTYRMEAEQSDFHPTNGMPSISVEGCVNDGVAFNLGFVTIFPENDADPFISIDCQENIGAYDPNDKIGYPVGLGGEHEISEDTELEYRIRFQNTGTDTAFTVVIKDTLSAYLNPATIRMGASSHPYEWTILGTNTLQLTFDNIMLPDSNVNEVASHGFFKFKIKQKGGNQPGTVINNSAAIYFDFNEPVITNTAFHTIEEKMLLTIVNEDSDCDHWFFTESTNFNLTPEFSYYEIDQENIFTIGSSTTYVDTFIVTGSDFMGVPYDADATVELLYSNVDDCDSLVVYNIMLYTNLSETDSASAISIFPNPANDKVSIFLDLTAPMEAADLKIYNQVGQELQRISLDDFYLVGKHHIPIELNQFEAGIYLLHIQTKTFSWTEKLVIRK